VKQKTLNGNENRNLAYPEQHGKKHFKTNNGNIAKQRIGTTTNMPMG
jgi:hypothetical protein